MKQDLSIPYVADRKLRSGYKVPLFLVRIFNYEYWPFWILFSPIVFYWLYLSLRARSLTWFTATNPGIELGGFFGESKINILKKIPSEYLPVSLFFEAGSNVNSIIQSMEEASLSFPVIAKPDKGEMGFQVSKIHNETELINYLKESRGRLIIQEFIEFENELGILYHKYPDGSRSGITSIVKKEFLKVTGDGVSTIRELMEQSDRARFQIEAIAKKLGDEIYTVLSSGEKYLLEPIGNHCRGTKFINGNDLINPELVKVFDKISESMDGFYYGRFDLKVKNINDLYTGKNIRIMEVNGVSSEPAHIYDGNMNLFKVYKDLFSHATIVGSIAGMNHQKGNKYIPFSVLIKTIVNHFKEKRINGN
jgi:RimK-like ATP-grasp domain